MNFKEISYEKADRVAIVSYNRPERMNAWTMRMGEEARQAMLNADRDPQIGAIILTGAGRAFCSGADMQSLNNLAQGTDQLADAGRPQPGTEELDLNFRGRFSWMMALKKTVIGAINGPAVGMGFANTLYCDIRVAAEQSADGADFHAARTGDRVRQLVDAAPHHRHRQRHGPRDHRSPNRRAGSVPHGTGKQGRPGRRAHAGGACPRHQSRRSAARSASRTSSGSSMATSLRTWLPRWLTTIKARSSCCARTISRKASRPLWKSERPGSRANRRGYLSSGCLNLRSG